MVYRKSEYKHSVVHATQIFMHLQLLAFELQQNKKIATREIE